MLSKEDGPINNEKDSKRVYGRTGSQGWGKTKISSLTPYPQDTGLSILCHYRHLPAPRVPVVHLDQVHGTLLK